MYFDKFLYTDIINIHLRSLHLLFLALTAIKYVSRRAHNAYNYKPENLNVLRENYVLRKICLAAMFRTLNTESLYSIGSGGGCRK
jgi:hypothetical protein